MCRWRLAAHAIGARGGPSGFTFLEILIALCVVLIALVPLLRLHLVSIHMIDSGCHKTRAALLANDRLAEIMAREAPDLGESSGCVEDANDGMVYRWTAEVTETRPPEAESVSLPGLRRVCVEVAWQEGEHDVVVALDTYVHAAGTKERGTLESKDSEESNQQTIRSPRSSL